MSTSNSGSTSSHSVRSTIFVLAAYTTDYNFAVANYNDVSEQQKKSMVGGKTLLYRSIVAVAWIISAACALLALLKSTFFIGSIVIGIIYIGLSVYNIYVYMNNRSLVRGTRILKAKVAGPSGLQYEWVSVPIASRSSNERLAAVEQAALDDVRKAYTGSNQTEVKCLVYTQRYADTYPSFPKEVLLHILAFLLAIIVGSILALI
jgi:hypothetical protein